MSDAVVPTATVNADVHAYIEKLASFERSGRSGAKWFYWIAGMSLLNSAILLFGGETFFVIGLGITLFADAFAQGAASEMPAQAQLFKGVALGFDVIVAAVVVMFGWLAGKRYLVVYALGMVLYLLDGLIFVWLQDWMSAGFHAFALFWMWTGLRAFRQQRALLNQPPLPTVESATNSTSATL
jgi:hypothetical protein